jgi:hypothetical protein
VAVRLEQLLRDPGAGVVLGSVTTTPGNGTVGVSVAGSDLVLPHLRGYTPAINDSVVILAQGRRMVVLDAYVNPSDPVVPRTPAPAPSQPKPKPPAPKPVVNVTQTFTAKATGCFRSGSWRTDTRAPHQGDWNGAYGRNTGAWFYGTQIRAALAGATVLKAKVYMVRLSGGVYGTVSPTIYTTPHASQPSGSPTLQGGGTSIGGLAVNSRGWISLPLALAQALANGSAYGLACFVASDSPYAAYAALADSRSSGAIQLTYKKG